MEVVQLKLLNINYTLLNRLDLYKINFTTSWQSFMAISHRELKCLISTCLNLALDDYSAVVEMTRIQYHNNNLNIQ